MDDDSKEAVRYLKMHAHLTYLLEFWDKDRFQHLGAQVNLIQYIIVSTVVKSLKDTSHLLC
jgi:hypothetical protein